MYAGVPRLSLRLGDSAFTTPNNPVQVPIKRFLFLEIASPVRSGNIIYWEGEPGVDDSSVLECIPAGVKRSSTGTPLAGTELSSLSITVVCNPGFVQRCNVQLPPEFGILRLIVHSNQLSRPPPIYPDCHINKLGCPPACFFA
jgi:hypothetical protein